MKPIVPISLKRIAVRHMADVRDGRLSRSEAERILSRHTRAVSREELIDQLTRSYDPEHAEALRFFRLL